MTTRPVRPLPRLLVLTDRRLARRPLPEVVARAAQGGARAVVLRERDLPAPERAQLAHALADVLRPLDGLLVLAGDEVLEADVADARHLSARDPLPAQRPALLGRSCHDAAEVASAAAEGCDWVTVSPVCATASKPGYGPALGLAGLAALVAGAPPVFALGGVTPAVARACVAAGAHGVAVMGAVMRAERPEREVAALLAALPRSAASAGTAR